MDFVKTEGTEELEEALTESLGQALSSGQKVLWLVPGGSNIPVVVTVLNSLEASRLKQLTLMLTDERYGEPDHDDSNYFQLHEAGLEVHDAAFRQLLTGQTFEETVEAYAKAAQEAFEAADFRVGFFGLGADGHIAGILPRSPATSSEEKWAVGYDAGQYKRMTLTPFALSHLDTAFVGAFGEGKRQALDDLCQTVVSVSEQPSRILCHLGEVTVFNDQMGDE